MRRDQESEDDFALGTGLERDSGDDAIPISDTEHAAALRVRLRPTAAAIQRPSIATCGTDARQKEQVVTQCLKSVALPRGLEPLFSP